jgi:hypothetical protein
MHRRSGISLRVKLHRGRIASKASTSFTGDGGEDLIQVGDMLVGNDVSAIPDKNETIHVHR